MHVTKEGKYFTEAQCTEWFERKCECGHQYGIHTPNESCHHQNRAGKFCPCRAFSLAVKTRFPEGAEL